MNTASTPHADPPGEERRRPRGFTLVETLVVCAVLGLLLVFLTSILNQATSALTTLGGDVAQFQQTREAFDIMTNRLSLATLNPYWDYRREANGDLKDYVRQSELRFRTGDASLLMSGSASGSSTKAVFFQAPGGSSASGINLQGALNTWGYFVEYGSDHDYRAPFLNGKIPEKYRFRLIEMMEPGDALSVYLYTSGTDAGGNAKNLGYTGSEWFQKPLVAANKRILAENVVALVVLPKLSPEEDPTGAALSPHYAYDTTVSGSTAAINSKNQLPPLVEVTIVTLDERSALRFNWTAQPPGLGLDSLFQESDKASIENDLNTLETSLRHLGFTPRRFSATIALRAAKWSTQQAN